MGTTILAVDDSATMRKILEITFSASNFRLVAVASSSEAKKQLSQGGVDLMICDNSLEDDGYEVAKALKSAAPQVPLLFLSSRQNPYDGTKGASANVDDHMDKPFDTQQLLDRVAKLGSGASAGAAAHAAPSASPAAAQPPTPAAAPKPAAVAPKPAAAPVPSPTKAAGFGAGGLGSPKPAVQATPAPAPVAARPAVATPAPQPAPAVRAPVPVAAAVTAASNEMAAKVGSMGLSPAEAQAILALSRDLIEKVIWEVVPVMAETLIKEEIARLTK